MENIVNPNTGSATSRFPQHRQLLLCFEPWWITTSLDRSSFWSAECDFEGDLEFFADGMIYWTFCDSLTSSVSMQNSRSHFLRSKSCWVIKKRREVDFVSSFYPDLATFVLEQIYALSLYGCRKVKLNLRWKFTILRFLSAVRKVTYHC